MDLLALVMIVAVCGAMLLAIVRGNWVVGPGVAGGTASAAVPTRQDPPVPVQPVSLEGAQIVGSHTAPVAIVEFSDFQCPFCGRFARDTWPTIQKAYVQSGKVLFAFREFPLEAIHGSALEAAKAAECAGLQGQFWKLHDALFADQAHLGSAVLEADARTAGVDSQKFDQCLSGWAEAKVKADERAGDGLAVSGTPTFFIGRLQPDGAVKVVRRMSGAPPAAAFGAAIDVVLKGVTGH
jgi:protein-disulfide isomerase